MPLLPGQLAICVQPDPDYLTLHTVYSVLHVRETGGILVDSSWPYFKASRFARFHPYIYTRAFLQKITCTMYLAPDQQTPDPFYECTPRYTPLRERVVPISTPIGASAFDEFLGTISPTFR